MNSKITFRSLLVVIYLLLSFNLQAQEVLSTTVNVPIAGSLPTLISSTKKYLITNLTVTGNLNGTDICFIREMAGRDVNGNSTTGKLTTLDLSGANIVAGGSYYCYNNNVNEYTSSNKIGDYTFYYCTGLTSVAIPNSVTSIGDKAFYYCTGLTSITIPNSVTSIGFEAFRGCTGSTSVTIPNSLTSIGDGAFRGCTGLTSVTIPNSMASTGNSAFSDCTGLTSVTIPNSVTSIGDNAFWSCTGLTSITIPNSVISIGKNAFRDCSKLASVNIPNSVTSIGDNAFYYCTGLTKIHCKALTPQSVTSETFYKINKTTCELYVPKGTFTIYKYATGWSDFTNIIEEESTAITEIKTNNMKIYSEQNTIVITGANLGDNISIYTESGTLLQSTKATDNIVRINVPTNHIYFIKTSNKTFKMAL